MRLCVFTMPEPEPDSNDQEGSRPEISGNLYVLANWRPRAMALETVGCDIPRSLANWNCFTPNDLVARKQNRLRASVD